MGLVTWVIIQGSTFLRKGKIFHNFIFYLCASFALWHSCHYTQLTLKTENIMKEMMREMGLATFASTSWSSSRNWNRWHYIATFVPWYCGASPAFGGLDKNINQRISNGKCDSVSHFFVAQKQLHNLLLLILWEYNDFNAFCIRY